LVLVTSIAKQSRANGNVSYRHSPTTNVDNPNALAETRSNNIKRYMQSNKLTFEKSISNSSYLKVDYLKDGNDRQKKLFYEISNLGLMESFSLFNPIIVGTIPIGIDIPNSDVDLIVDISNHKISNFFDNFIHENRNLIFELKCKKNINNSFISKFETESFNFEIFGECQDTCKQFGFIHMMVENEILRILGEEFKNSIRELKYQGIKTEPAFCKLLGFENDPYNYLYNLKNLSLDDFSKEIKEAYSRARIG